MNIAVFTPIKYYSSRVPNKNFTEIGGVPLYERTFNLIQELKSSINDVFGLDFYVDTDCFNIESQHPMLESMQKSGIKYIKRDSELAKDTSSGDDLLRHHIEMYPDYDIYCQLYITCPFQRADSIKDSLGNLIYNLDRYDSTFLVHENYTWYWYDNKPINYTPGKLLRSQDALPVINETTGFYAITKKAWEKTQCRIGERPYMHPVSFLESVDIDNVEDLQLARVIADAKL